MSSAAGFFEYLNVIGKYFGGFFTPAIAYYYISLVWIILFSLTVVVFRKQIEFFLTHPLLCLKKNKKDILAGLFVFLVSFGVLSLVHDFYIIGEVSPNIVMSVCMSDLEEIYEENAICKRAVFGDIHEIGFPAFISFFLRLFGNHVWVLLIIPLFATSLGMVFIYLLLRKITSLFSSVAGSLIFLFVPLNLKLLSIPTKESFYFLFWAIFLLILYNLLNKKSKRGWVFFFWVGWIWSLSIDIKAQFVLVMPVFVTILLLRKVIRTRDIAILLIPFLISLPYKLYLYHYKFHNYLTFDIDWVKALSDSLAKYIGVVADFISFNIILLFLAAGVFLVLLLRKEWQQKDSYFLSYLLSILVISGVLIFIWDIEELEQNFQDILLRYSPHHMLIFCFLIWIILIFLIEKIQSSSLRNGILILVFIPMVLSFSSGMHLDPTGIEETLDYFEEIDKIVSNTPQNVTLYYTNPYGFFRGVEYLIVPSIRQKKVKSFLYRSWEEEYNFSSCEEFALFGKAENNDLVLKGYNSSYQERMHDWLIHPNFSIEEMEAKIMPDLRQISSCNYEKQAVQYDYGLEYVFLDTS